MGSLARIATRAFGRRCSLAAALALAGMLASASAGADEIAVLATSTGIQVHGPEETLREYCASDADGRLWIQLPGGRRFELVTSTDDAMVANPGDGSFHPYDEAEVRSALGAVRFPLGGLDVEVFLLPFPRRQGLESAAGPGLILLSPGVRPLSAEQQHAELVHELGHVVQYALLPDGDPRWSEYRSRRGIEDPARFRAGAIHADRPHEIFAEDFRALFGGVLANYSGSIENGELSHPSQVPGLADFMLGLVSRVEPGRLVVQGPNPARGALRFSRPGAAAVPLDLFDVAGRRIATLQPTTSGVETRWSWDGTDSRGTRVPAGMLLARPRDGRGPATRIGWLP